jgi:hypothetical protein
VRGEGPPYEVIHLALHPGYPGNCLGNETVLPHGTLWQCHLNGAVLPPRPLSNDQSIVPMGSYEDDREESSMTLGVFLAMFAVVAIGVGFFVIRYFSGRATRRVELDQPVSTPLASFTGAMRWSNTHGLGDGNATTPLAKFTLFDWGIRVGPSSRVLGFALPTIEMRYEEIQSVDPARSPFFKSACVRILANQAGAAVLFWTTDGAALLEALRLHGVNTGGVQLDLANSTWTKVGD